MSTKIVSRPAGFIWLSILLLSVLIALTVRIPLNKMSAGEAVSSDDWIAAVLLAPFLFLMLFQLRKVTIENGRILIVYYLRFKRVNASLDAITSVRVSLVNSPTRYGKLLGMKHGIIEVSLLKGKHDLKMHSLFCSNLPAFEDFFRKNCPEVFYYGRIAS